MALMALAAIAGFFYWRSSRGPSISDKSVLLLKIEGEMPEYAPPPLLGTGTYQLSVWETRDLLQKAAVDPRIAAVWVWIDMPWIGWGKVEELSSYIEQFRKSKKPIIGYLNAADERGYSLALSCDQIFAPGEAFLEMNGLAAEIMHYPGLLEKLGIKIQFERCGKYKSVSGEAYGRKDLSEPVREMINSLVEDDFQMLVSRMSERRKMTKEQIVAILERGQYFARKSIDAGLLDGDRDEIAMEDYLKQKIGESGKLHIVHGAKYRNVPRSAVGLDESGDRIAVVFAQGMIMQGRGGFNPIFFETEQGSDAINEALDSAAEDDSTKAIVLRVNSPGGSGFGPDVICNKIVQVQKKKPVIISMSDYAASGGYWISMAARKIVAQPMTVTGSIGVWGIFPDFSEFHSKLGLTVDIIKRGSHADMLLADRPFDETERELFRQSIFDTYNDFVRKASQYRHMPLTKMEDIAQGRSWLGVSALKNGLIDDLGGIDRAIEIAQKEGKAQGPVELWLPGQKSWLDRVIEKIDSQTSEDTPLLSEVEKVIRELRSVWLYEADPQLVEVR